MWIGGYEGIAAVSDKGRIFSEHGGGLITPYTDKGQRYARLWPPRGPRIAIGRAVLTAFVRPGGPDERALHINDADDNRLENLYWGTKSDLSRNATSRRTRTTGKILPEDTRKVIREKVLNKKATYDELAEWYGVSSRTIRRIGEGL